MLAIDYNIPRAEQNLNYVLVERCFTPEQRWQNARFIETWVENVNMQPVTLVLQFAEGRRCGHAPFTGEVWKSTIVLQPGEKRPINWMLKQSQFFLAGFAPTQNQIIDLDKIGYLAIGVESANPTNSTLRVGTIRLWP